MKQLLVFIKKEFYHVFRDPRTLIIMYGLPLSQILMFGFALTSEVKNAHMIVIDHAQDSYSEQLINKLNASTYFTLTKTQTPYNEIETEFRKGHTKAVIVLPKNFEKDLKNSKSASIQIITDGTEPNTAKTLIQYINSITLDFQQEINTNIQAGAIIVPELRMLYNEEGNGSINFVPGVMAMILMIVCTALTSVAVVREKELGTMEILLVSPFNPLMVLVAKAIPFLILSLINLIFILLLSVFVMQVPMLGSTALFFLVSLLFISTSLALGLVISNSTNSQQIALLVSMIGMLLPTIIFTGFLFPIENMPKVFQWISNLVPAKWYYTAIKSIMLKGLGIQYVWKEISILTVLTLLLIRVAIAKFKIRMA